VSRPTIGYALSGGAVRGAAHLGFLSVFEQAGIHPDAIAGTSAGAVVGAAYAAGMPVELIAEKARQAHWREITGAPGPQRLSVFSSTPLSDWIADSIGELTFEELETPLAVVTCNLVDGSPVVLDEGSVVEAAVASAAVPGLFAPVERGDMLLVDGGLVENLPVSVARAMGVDVVVAVDVNPARRVPRKPENLRELMESAKDIMSRSNKAVSRHDADFLVQPGTEKYGTWDYGRIDAIIDAGREAALVVLPDVLAVLG
jgi:NTE family protein